MKSIASLWLGLSAVLSLSCSLPGIAGDDPPSKVTPPKPYPLETCVVSGKKLKDVEEPVVFVYKGREVQLCCKGCKKDFTKSPGKFMAQVRKASRRVVPYTAKTCAATGEKFDDTPYAIVISGREYKFCSQDCAQEFRLKLESTDEQKASP